MRALPISVAWTRLEVQGGGSLRIRGVAGMLTVETI